MADLLNLGKSTPGNFAPLSDLGARRVLGYKVRDTLFGGEDEYFRKNPNIAGMASESGDIILNPYSPPNVNRDAVARNEAFRLFLRDKNLTPNFGLSEEQIRSFSGTAYGSNDDALKQTIAARIFSGDPSANATPEQIDWVKRLNVK